MDDSIFTKIIKGEIPAYKVYEDERTLAFLDIHPLNPGHVLLIPKEQIDSIWDVPDDLYRYLWDVSRKIADRINTVISPPRVGVIVEGFGVPHVHIHLIPIYKGEDLKKHQNLTTEPDHAALAAMAEKLKF